MQNENRRIKELVKMEKPNDAIIVHQGVFQLATDEIRIEVNGIVEFEWFPSLGTRFSGEVVADSREISRYVQFRDYDLLIDGLVLGKCFLNVIISSDTFHVEGNMKDITILGDKTIPVSKLNFAVANMREFHGSSIKTEAGYTSGRLLLENDEYLVVIDKRSDYSERNFMLRHKGGYLILYTGELSSKKGHFTQVDVGDILLSLSTFLNFLNGRRCSPIFRSGVFEDETKWCDYTAYHVDQFKFINSWAPSSIIGLNVIWEEFCKLWSDKNHRHFINDAIHWYTEANSQSGLVDGAIIMAQTALELIYNWLLVEQKRLIIGKDADSISASNKIRLLISLLKINNDVPDSLINLKKYVDEAGDDVADAPDAFVQIRNALVHSQTAKRKKVSEMNKMLKYEALQLSLWYIELSLLYIFNYNGEYVNRCHIYKNELNSKLPWN